MPTQLGGLSDIALLRPFRGVQVFVARSLQSVLHLIQRAVDQARARAPAHVGFPRIEVPAWWRLVEEFEHDHEQWSDSLPDNWRGLSMAELEAVGRAMERTGWVLAWVPREEILRELIGTRDRRDAAGRLLAHQDDVLDDLKKGLGEITDSSLADLSVALHQGVRSYEWGYTFPAQAIAAVVLTSLINQQLEATDTGESPLLTFRRNSLLRAGGTALNSYWPSAEDPVPSLFHPYVTAHHFDLTHFNQAHALAGLMLGVSFLRDLEAAAERD